MIPHRHAKIPYVSSHNDVFHLRKIRQAIEREVGLDEAAMCLRFDELNPFPARRRAEIDPWREIPNQARLQILKDQVHDDRLHPGGARLHRGGNDDIVIARDVIVPAGAIQMMILVYMFHLGQLIETYHNLL